MWFVRDLVDGNEKLSPDDALGIPTAIEGFFFVFNYRPRELKAEIRRPTLATIGFAIELKSLTDSWPVTLPAEMSQPRIKTIRRGQLSFWIYQYGTELPASSLEEVTSAIQQIQKEIYREKSDTINKKSYSSGFVTLEWMSNNPKDIFPPIKSLDVEDLCTLIIGEFMKANHDPRELGILLVEDPRGEKKPFAKAHLLFHWDQQGATSDSLSLSNMTTPVNISGLMGIS